MLRSLSFLQIRQISIRQRIVRECEGNAEELNKRSKAVTNARTQARIADLLQDVLTEEELAVYKRGRNLKSLTAPKSCSISEYRRATGLEALMGYLYLEGRQERIDELIDTAAGQITQNETNES